MSVLLEETLDEEINVEFGYSKHDFCNKETNISRNGHSKKMMYTSYGNMDVAIPRDHNVGYEPAAHTKISEHSHAAGHGR